MKGLGWLALPGQWLAALGSRERRVVVGGGVLVAAVLLHTLLIEPALAWLEGQRRLVAEKQATLDWMKEAAGEVARL